MTWNLSKWRVNDLFFVKSGDIHAMNKELDPGETPLISCGDVDNGFVGNFTIPVDKRHERCLTVAYNGRPLMTKFHPYEFGTKDDVAVLKPRLELQDATLLFVAASLNRLQWRYSYGRKCFRQKLQGVEILLPMTSDGDIDEDLILTLFADIPYWDFAVGGRRGVPTKATTLAR